MIVLFMICFLLLAMSAVFLFWGLISPKSLSKAGGNKVSLTRKSALLGFGGFTVLFFVLSALTAAGLPQQSTASKAQVSRQSAPKPVTHNKPAPQSLTASQRAQVVSIATANTNHIKQEWQDGLDALGTTQYPDGSTGVAALNDPKSNASKFSHYQQIENPGEVNSVNSIQTAFKQADAIYAAAHDSNDDTLNNWRMDMSQLSSDCGTWVQDAVSWQISAKPTSQLDADKQTVEQDFATVQADLQAIK